MPEEVYSVSDITADIRGSLETQFSGIWIEGEISNHRLPASGHHYFTLKDSFAQLSCVLFRGAAAKLPIPLKDGMQVQIFGNISVYEARGQYQLIAQTVQPKGAGDLQAKFEELKRKLEAEGLFDAEKKKPLPPFPTRIGIVTSPTGAAIRDMLQVFSRRAPWLQLLIYPARVQGEEAAHEIAEGIRVLDKAEEFPRPDLLIVARGGGSIEDLWSFNEEVVARAIANCSLPVISGVGHEIDFTIADFVADRREPTPSAAAENATPEAAALKRHLTVISDALETRTENALTRLRKETLSLKRELDAQQPRRRIQSRIQTLDFLGEKLEHIIDNRISSAQANLQSTSRAWSAIRPDRFIATAREKLEATNQRLEETPSSQIRDQQKHIESLHLLLESLSPDATVKRGFSMTLDARGNPITTVKAVKSGDRITTKLSDGEVESIVE